MIADEDDDNNTDRLHNTLDAIVAELTRQGHPLASRLAPGISEDQIQTRAATLGLRLPAEATAIWQWHNGITPPVDWTNPGDMIGTKTFYSIDEMVDLTGQVHEWTEQVAIENEESPDEYFWRSWVVLFSNFPLGTTSGTAFECVGEYDDPCAVYSFGAEEGHRAIQPSLTAVFEIILEYFTSGTYRYDRDTGRFIYPFPGDMTVPEHLRTSGI